MRAAASGDLANMAGMAQNQTSGQARFTRRFTQAQKDALLKAVLVDGHTIKAARELAAAGQLDVPAFTVGNYAYDIVKDGRDAFESSNEQALDRAIDAELKRTAALALAHNRAILAKARRDGTDNPDDMRRSAQALSAIKRARKEANPPSRAKPAPQATEDQSVSTPQSPSVVSDLLAKAGEHGKTGSLSGAQTGRAA